MMKKRLLILALLCQSVFVLSQVQIAVGYNYMIAGGWDRAIQTYNFARPELTEKQPLLIHGIEVATEFLRDSGKYNERCFMASYRYFRSSAHNDNFDATLNAHLVNIGYGISTQGMGKQEAVFCDVSISVLCGGIFRSVNKDPIRDDGKRVWAPGIGGELRPRIGYNLVMKDRWCFSPYFQTTYCPFYYSPRAEAVLNQTMTLTGVKYTGILSLEIGIVFTRATTL
jgi:hypothetical protein